MYKKSISSWLKHLDFLIIDMILIQLGLVISYMMRFGISVPYADRQYQELSIYLILIHFCVVFFNESYHNVLRRGHLQELKSALSEVTLIIVGTLVLLFMLQISENYSRIIFLLMWIIDMILIYVVHLIRKLVICKKYKNGKGNRSIIVIAATSNIENIIETMQLNNFESLTITGIVIMDSDLRGDRVRGVPIVAGKMDVMEYLKENWVDEVFFALPKELYLPDAIINDCIDMGITIHLQLTKLAVGAENQIVEKLAGFSVLSNSIHMMTYRQLFFKRGLDIAGGLVGVVLTGIIAILIAPIIYIQSPGPIFFSQIRVGMNGRKFKIYKFRSMYKDAEERKKELMEQNNIKDGLMFKMDNDPRIFPFGHHMRKASIDELPQLWNVLKGEMSLVGTRPPTMDEWEKYGLYHRRRLAMKPGITGLWQVSGRSQITDFEKVVELDTQYITSWSLGLDIRILLKTVVVVLKSKGAS